MGKLVDAAALTLFARDEVLQPQLIPVEINLEGWPLFSRQKTPDGGAFEIRESISTDDGRRLDQLWRVTASHDFSLPGSYDEDVFVGVMALVRRRGGMPKDGKIRFSLRAYGDGEVKPVDYVTKLDLVPPNLPNPFLR